MLFLSPIYAHTDVEIFNDNPVVIQWQKYGEEYEYMVKIYRIENDEETLIHTSEWIVNNILCIETSQEGSYYWDLYIREVGKDCNDEYQCLNIESGYFDFYIVQEPDEQLPKEEDNSKEEVKTTKVVTENVSEEIEEVLGAATEQYIAKQEFLKENKNTKESSETKTQSYITTERDYCRFTYNIKKKKFELEECDITKPTVSSSTYYTYNDYYIVNSRGKYQDSIEVYIENVTCRNFNLLNPKTWFRCDEVTIGQNEYTVDFDHEVYFSYDKTISPMNYIFRDNFFEIATLLDSLPTDLIFKGYFSIKHRGTWLDQELVFKKSVSFTKIKNHDNSKYGFPFSKIIYVNQWHGCTAYQCPHKGIDFAAVKEKIYASDNGIVVSKGYDTYSGECNSGGNYLVIKYDEGHYMSYMHLEKIYVKNNQKIEKGDLIALSGNTGMHNCQPLGYHLHFELREKRSQSTHIDPVPYIDINWNLVRTNKADIYPGRLTGDNPHPTF